MDKRKGRRFGDEAEVGAESNWMWWRIELGVGVGREKSIDDGDYPGCRTS